MRKTSGRCRAVRSAHSRTARSTVWASGHLRTDEVSDLTGICDRLSALQRPVVLEGRPFRMAVRIARWNVEGIEVPHRLVQPIAGTTRHSIPPPGRLRGTAPAG